MSEEFGPTFITLTDEDGQEHTLELVGMLEHEGTIYQAFLTAETEGEEENEEEGGVVIMKVIHENGEELLSLPDSEEEADAIYELFMEELFADEDEE